MLLSWITFSYFNKLLSSGAVEEEEKYSSNGGVEGGT